MRMKASDLGVSTKCVAEVEKGVSCGSMSYSLRYYILALKPIWLDHSLLSFLTVCLIRIWFLEVIQTMIAACTRFFAMTLRVAVVSQFVAICINWRDTTPCMNLDGAEHFCSTTASKLLILKYSDLNERYPQCVKCETTPVRTAHPNLLSSILTHPPNILITNNRHRLRVPLVQSPSLRQLPPEELHGQHLLLAQHRQRSRRRTVQGHLLR